LQWTTEEQICEDDKVVSRYTWSGTQVRDFRYIPATGRKMTIAGIAIDRFAHGQFVETRMLRDDVGSCVNWG
jgi:predicted ester cyclase